MRLLRMTMRRWMMAVATISLVLAVGLCVERRAVFLNLAERNVRSAQFWDVHEQRYLADGTPMFNGEFFDSDGIVKPSYRGEFERTSKRYAALGRKYSYAAAHPWLTVEAAPPEPR